MASRFISSASSAISPRGMPACGSPLERSEDEPVHLGPGIHCQIFLTYNTVLYCSASKLSLHPVAFCRPARFAFGYSTAPRFLVRPGGGETGGMGCEHGVPGISRPREETGKTRHPKAMQGIFRAPSSIVMRMLQLQRKSFCSYCNVTASADAPTND